MRKYAAAASVVLILSCLNAIWGGVREARAQESAAVLARAGKQFITEREFLERFELTPGLHRHRKAQLEDEKLATLYSLVAEKLLAQEALDRGLDQDSVFQSALHEVTRLLARDELYRQEVRGKVSVTPGELREGMQQARQERRVRYLFSPDSATVLFLRARIRSVKDFDLLALDSTMDVLRDTATIIWGDAEPAIESAAYGLKEGRISSPVKAGDGWYLLRLISTQQNVTYGQLSPQVLRERVEDLIRQRKERKREREFVGEELRGKKAFSRPEAFRAFAGRLESVMRKHFRSPSTALRVEMGDELRQLLGPMARDTLVLAGETSWSMDNVIDRLVLRGFSVTGDSVRAIPHRLYTVLEETAQQELLAQEGMRRGLDLVPDVRAKLEPWRDHYLAGIVRRRLNAGIEVTEGETFSYLKSRDAGFPVPEVQLRLLRSRSREVVAAAMKEVDRGESFASVFSRYSSDPAMNVKGETLPFFPVNEHPPLGMIAAQLDSGQIYGPVRDSASFLLMQLIGKRNQIPPDDTSFTGRIARGREDVRRMKERRMATLLVAQSAENKGYEIYADRLQALKVSSVPMLAYRILGFGGRMFEVPFVEPQLQWLETAPPKEPVLP